MLLIEEAKALIRRWRLEPETRNTALRRLYETNLLFVHVPKCGGKTVVGDLYRLEDTRWFGHADVKHFRAILGPSRFDQVHKVTFVRDPVDRCLSGYRFNKSGGFGGATGLKSQALLEGVDFDQFVQSGMLEEFISWHIVFRPQISFLADTSGAIAVDQICSFANFETELQQLLTKLYSETDVSHRNESKAKKPAQIEEATKTIIHDLYAADYQALSEWF